MLSAHPACNPACRVCHYKDLAYPDQLRRKQDWAVKNLGRWGGVLQPIIAAPEEERLEYRAKSWMRAARIGDEVSFGMFRAINRKDESGKEKWGKEFVSWDGCPIHTSAIQETTENLRKALADRHSAFVDDGLHGVWIGVPHLVIVARDDRFEDFRQLDWNKDLSRSHRPSLVSPNLASRA